jgi:hypothetical protein
MNWSALGAISEFLGALAVVASLVYLAAQVKANTRQSRHDASRDLAVRISEVSIAVASTREMGELLLRGGGDHESLDRVDHVRFRGLMNALFRGLEQQYLLREEGALGDDEWVAVESIVSDFATLPGVRQYFSDRGQWYTPGFLEVVWRNTPLEARPSSGAMAEQYRADAT